MSKSWFVRDIRVFDTGRSAFSSPTNLLIEDNIITRIGNDDPGMGDGFEKLDCKGKFAIPGLWECHGHLMELCSLKPTVRSMVLMNRNLSPETDWDVYVQDQLSDFLKRGVTHIRDVGGPLKGLKSLAESINSGVRNGPDIRYSGPMLEKPPLHWAQKNRRYPGFTVAVDSKEFAEKAVRILKQGGASHVKTFNKWSVDVFTHLVEQAQRYDLPVTHDPGGALYKWIPVDLALARGIRCFEHAQSSVPVILKPGYKEKHEMYRYSPPESEENRAFFREVFSNAKEAVDAESLEDLCRELTEKDACVCPTLFTLQGMRTRFKDDPPNEGEALRRKINREFCDLMQMIVETMAAHGVKILVGHDSSHTRGVALEMKYLHEWGVSPAEIIKGATIYPAEWMGADAEYGTIEPGKIADLVVLDKNPLSDIANVEAVRWVFHRGEWITSIGQGSFIAAFRNGQP